MKLETLDPTTMNRQGNDVGTQYASWIFCSDEQQLHIATKVREELEALVHTGKVRYAGSTIHTQIGLLKDYYPAHDGHQQYLMKNPHGYCNHRFRFKEWPSTVVHRT